MNIFPVNREWIHDHLVTPSHLGVGLMNFAWKGHDNSLIPKTYSLTERCQLWALGAFLLLGGKIAWIICQTFGNLPKLVDPFSFENVSSPRLLQTKAPFGIEVQPNIKIRAIPLNSLSKGQVRSPEKFLFYEYFDKKFVYSTFWKVEYYPNKSIVTRHSSRFRSKEIYQSDMGLQLFHHVKKDKTLEISSIESRKLKVVLNNHHTVILEKKENIPWIQYPIFGLRNFFCSKHQEMYFYTVLFQNPLDASPLLCHLGQKAPFLLKMHIQKKQIENVSNLGRLLKIEARACKFPYNTKIAEAWVHPNSGLLIKYKNPVNNNVGILDPSDQLL